MSAAHELIPAVLDDLELTWEPGVHAQEWVVTLPGEKKLKTVVSLQISGGALLTRAFVIRNPDENHAAFYRYLLRRNLRLPALAYAIDGSGDVYVTGRVPLAAVDAAYLDQLLGVVLEAADAPFNELLVLGFLTAIQKEWDWRVARGESLRNLEAFRGVLDGTRHP
ncbi:YbjN domain-containing protein [Nostocoides sp.]|uniref:YbjN domain-containing protein n=1 Tax=Nostocoides sp. TaxID=1917966 RepID=UPI003BB0E901